MIVQANPFSKGELQSIEAPDGSHPCDSNNANCVNKQLEGTNPTKPNPTLASTSRPKDDFGPFPRKNETIAFHSYREAADFSSTKSTFALSPNSPPGTKRTDIPSSPQDYQKSTVTPTKTSESRTRKIGTNVGLVLGVVAAVVILVLAFAYGGYKYRSRDEGTYKIDSDVGYGFDVSNSKPLVHLNGRAKCESSRSKTKDSKEWYVWNAGSCSWKWCSKTFYL